MPKFGELLLAFEPQFPPLCSEHVISSLTSLFWRRRSNSVIRQQASLSDVCRCPQSVVSPKVASVAGVWDMQDLRRCSYHWGDKSGVGR